MKDVIAELQPENGEVIFYQGCALGAEFFLSIKVLLY